MSITSLDEITTPEVAAPSKKNKTVVAALLLAVAVTAMAIVTGVVIVGQHKHVQDLEHKNSSLAGQLKHTKADLGTAQDDLQSTQNDLSNANSALTTCQALTTVSKHLLDSGYWTTKAYLANSNGDLFSAITDLSKGKTATDQAARAIHAAGYDNLPDLNAACNSTGTGI